MNEIGADTGLSGSVDGQDCRVLIVKLSSLGDLFHALPAVSTIKERLSARIDWCVQEEYVDLVRCFDEVDRIIPFPRRAFFSRLKHFRQELRREQYDYVIDMQGLIKSCVVTLMARGRRKIGPSFAREGTGILYPEKASGGVKGRHAVNRIMDVIRYLNLSPLDVEFRVTFPRVEITGGHPRIGLVPCSRWDTKTWPASCFVETAKRMLKSGPMSFYVIGGTSDSGVCEEVARGIGSCAQNMAGRYSIPQSGGLIQQMDLLITNDSGPMHMAAAVGVPVLAVFGPTDDRRTGPYGKLNRVLTADVSCRPCFSRTCRVGVTPCLTGVSNASAAAAALEMLDTFKADCVPRR